MIRDTLPGHFAPDSGFGIMIYSDSHLEIQSSSLDNNRNVSLIVGGGTTVSLTDVLIRRTQAALASRAWTQVLTDRDWICGMRSCMARGGKSH